MLREVLPATAMSGAQLCGRWASRAERAERRAGAVGAVVRAETTVEVSGVFVTGCEEGRSVLMGTSRRVNGARDYEMRSLKGRKHDDTFHRVVCF